MELILASLPNLASLYLCLNRMVNWPLTLHVFKVIFTCKSTVKSVKCDLVQVQIQRQLFVVVFVCFKLKVRCWKGDTVAQRNVVELLKSLFPAKLKYFAQEIIHDLKWVFNWLLVNNFQDTAFSPSTVWVILFPSVLHAYSGGNDTGNLIINISRQEKQK